MCDRAHVYAQTSADAQKTQKLRYGALEPDLVFALGDDRLGDIDEIVNEATG